MTSNKLVVEKYGRELEEAALQNNVCYLYEASAGGGIPLIHPLCHCLSANKITKVAGILNGTTNYILERMESDGISFEEALADAKRLGYAEVNPEADIKGYDTARKICILASVCFGSRFYLDDLAEITGIDQTESKHIIEAARLGYKIKLLGVAEVNERGKPCCLSSPALFQRTACFTGKRGVQLRYG